MAKSKKRRIKDNNNKKQESETWKIVDNIQKC